MSADNDSATNVLTPINAKYEAGLIREGKEPPDKRVAFTPQQVEEIEQRFPL